MTLHQPTNPRQICESYLNQQKCYNIENHILRSENAVIDRLLERGVEMMVAYKEMHDKLGKQVSALEVFLSLILSTAAYWSPEKMLKEREQRKALSQVNQKIGAKAIELAKLLQKRDEIHNSSALSSNTHYSVFGVIEAAAKDNHLFNSWLRTKFVALHGQFDLKYWPSLEECMDEVATNAIQATIETTNQLTAAGTKSTRPSLADYFRGLFAAIEQNSERDFGQLPTGLVLTDSTFAMIANCALDLSEDEMVDGPYVKGIRQRQREEEKLV